jgi:hypothetical protein
MIVSAIIIFISLTIFFPGFSYQDNWDEALIVLKGRDAILTIDDMNMLYSFSFEEEELEGFLDNVTNETALIPWSETQGTLKSRIRVACNCTPEQRDDLYSWFGELRINNRTIRLEFLDSNLTIIHPGTDLLLIWGYKDLTSYEENLKDYLRDGNGIVEIMDFSNPLEDVQRQIFGIEDGGSWGSRDCDIILKPLTVDNVTYQPYKYFYHVPFPLKATSLQGDSNCGNFTLRSTDYEFCINASGVYIEDERVIEREIFTIDSDTFLLNNVADDATFIDVSFRPDYNFTEFAFDTGIRKIVPINDEDYRTFMRIHQETGVPKRGSVVVLNGTVGRTAWIADFSRGQVGDDHKLLLLTLLLHGSNKKAIGILRPSVKIGYSNSYINTVNYDMFEVYRFNLGLGYPY